MLSIREFLESNHGGGREGGVIQEEEEDEDDDEPDEEEHHHDDSLATSSMVVTGFVTSHPRQRRQENAKQRKLTSFQQQQHVAQSLSASSSSSNGIIATASVKTIPTTTTTTPPPPTLPTDDLIDAMTSLEEHVPLTMSAQRALDRVQNALETLQIKLQPPKALHVRAKLLWQDAIPAPLQQPWPNLKLYKSTYEANDPSEDRSTVVVGTDFIFGGVWDGHGGPQCSEFTQTTVFENFAQAYKDLHDKPAHQRVSQAFGRAFQQTNRDYYHHARTQNERQAYFAGTCAVACFLDLSQTNTQPKESLTLETKNGKSKTTRNGNSGSTATLYCANLGDSRAVLGILQKDGTLQARPLSVDHTAENLLERQRIQALHPRDPHAVVDLTKLDRDQSTNASTTLDPYEPPDWRVKKIAAFTRSIGDLQLKEKNTSALFNSYMGAANRILPRPGIVADKNSTVPTPPYISTEAEVQQVSVTLPSMTISGSSIDTANPSFVIIACDGVWDEMTSEEAVECVGDLLSQYPRDGSSNVNIADLFIEKVLEQVVERLRETNEDEADITLQELKQRPKGKAADGARSLLHDDITVVIIQLGSTKAFYKGRRGRSGRGLGHKNASVTSLKSLQKALLRQSVNRLKDPMQALQERLKDNDPERQETDKQIVAMMDFFDGMNIRHLKILFNALDVDGNGTLDREEIGRLINQVMLTDVSADVVNLAFEEMDADGSGAVDFFEFVAFFGHHMGKDDTKKPDTKHHADRGHLNRSCHWNKSVGYGFLLTRFLVCRKFPGTSIKSPKFDNHER